MHILCKKETRTTSKNLEVQHDHTTYQLSPPQSLQERLKRSKVKVITTLDEEIAFQYQGKIIEYKKFNEQPYVEVKPGIDELLNNWKDRFPRSQSRSHPWIKDSRGRLRRNKTH